MQWPPRAHRIIGASICIINKFQHALIKRFASMSQNRRNHSKIIGKAMQNACPARSFIAQIAASPPSSCRNVSCGFAASRPCMSLCVSSLVAILMQKSASKSAWKSAFEKSKENVGSESKVRIEVGIRAHGRHQAAQKLAGFLPCARSLGAG